MSLLNAVIRAAAPLPDLEKAERFLFVGPHPDDIEIGAGATAAKLAAAGKAVCFLICTDGRFGDTFCEEKGDALAKRREQEALASAARLGVKDVRFLRFSDGNVYDYAAFRNAIARVIGEFGPNVVFAPDPCVISECHADHLNTGNACRELAFAATNPGTIAAHGGTQAPITAIAYYMTASATRFVNTTGYLQKQLDAVFSCHTSQFPAGCDDAKSISLYLKLRAYDFGIRNFCRTAEGFRVLGTTQMHCLPEAGIIR